MDTTNARALSTRLADLLSREQAAMADFLVALADFDRRLLWEPLGYTSLWHYLHRELGLSKGTAHYRVVAAGLVAGYPEVEAALRDGRLCITSVVELARVLTPENQVEVLPRFFHRSKQEAKAVAAELRPREVVPRREVVTKPSVQPVELVAPLPPVALPPPPGPASTPRPVLPERSAPQARGVEGPARLAVEPLTADERRLHVTVSRRFLDKLEAAREALSRAKPGADAEAILEAGLDLLLAEQARRRAQVARPRQARAVPAPGEGSARVPAEVRRAVWARDEGRCQWRLDDGGICGATHRLELDHVLPRARGGPSTVENLRVLCAHHNRLAARLALGGRWMGRYVRTAGFQGRRPAGGAAPRAGEPRLDRRRRGRVAWAPWWKPSSCTCVASSAATRSTSTGGPGRSRRACRGSG